VNTKQLKKIHKVEKWMDRWMEGRVGREFRCQAVAVKAKGGWLKEKIKLGEGRTRLWKEKCLTWGAWLLHQKQQCHALNQSLKNSFSIHPTKDFGPPPIQWNLSPLAVADFALPKGIFMQNFQAYFQGRQRSKHFNWRQSEKRKKKAKKVKK